MKTIKEAERILLPLVGEQEFKEKLIYRKLIYLTEIECEDGYLVYNNLTGELLILSNDEFIEFNKCDNTCRSFLKYVKKWFYVPEDFLDILFCDQITKTLRTYMQSLRSNMPITSYTILTTTECNARCFYCFEKGRKNIKMTKETANDVAEYIKSSCKGEKITIRWFGGEPLYNLEVIDIISEQLKNLSIEFKSSIVSNGYLFNDEIINKCKDIWNVKEVQITLDGTEKIYNRVKAYVYDSSNPFNIVIDNIRKLLVANINVRIRLNHGKHNTNDLIDLIDFLNEKFAGCNNLKIYSRLLFEYSDILENANNKNEYWQLQKQNKELTNYIIARGFGKKWGIDGLLKYHNCMADDDTAIVILPDGHLGKCEHFSDNEICGTIYQKELNEHKIAEFKRTAEYTDICDTCPVRPNCYRLEKCPDKNKVCNEDFKIFCIENVKERMITTYNEWKSEQ